MAMAAAIDGQARAEQAALVARIGRGDRDALRELADLYARPMRRLAWRLLFDADEAEAVVRQAFALFWAGAPRWRDGGRVGAWFYRICTTLCLDRLRRREDKEQGPAAADAAGCLAALPPRARAAIVLTRCEALPNAAVAEILGMRLAAFEELLSQGRVALQACLRRNMIRAESLNHYLDDLQPDPPPADFAAQVAEGASRAREPGGKGARDRRGAWARQHRAGLGMLAAGLLVAGGLAALIAQGGEDEALRPANSVAQGDKPAPERAVRVALETPRAPPAPGTVIAPEPPHALPSPAHVEAEAKPRSLPKSRVSEPSRQQVAKAQLPSNAPPRRQAKAKRPPAPIPLLPKNFAKLVYPPEPPIVSETATERRARMRAYLRNLSAEELEELRREERALARERGLAQLPPR